MLKELLNLNQQRVIERIDEDDKKDALVKFFFKDKSITSLNLFGCSLNDYAIVHIINNLENNNIVESLDLDGNDISNVGAKHLLILLKSNIKITNISLNLNNISEDIKNEINKELKLNQDIQKYQIHISSIITWLNAFKKRPESSLYQHFAANPLFDINIAKEITFIMALFPNEKIQEINQKLEKVKKLSEYKNTDLWEEKISGSTCRIK